MRKALFVVVAATLVASGAFAAGASAKPRRVPHVIVFDQTLGFHHQSIEHAELALRKIARLDKVFTLEITQDPKALTTRTLSKADVVMWLSNTAGSVSHRWIQVSSMTHG